MHNNISSPPRTLLPQRHDHSHLFAHGLAMLACAEG